LEEENTEEIFLMVAEHEDMLDEIYGELNF
jgi:hypothetical protein